MGMAGVQEDSSSTFHGVLWLLTMEDMKKLDKLEGKFYKRTDAVARLYDGSVRRCTVYKFCEETLQSVQAPGMVMEDRPPTERYLNIIIQGCEHHGVCPEYIQSLRDLECQPRRPREQFRKLPEAPEGVFYTLEELARCDGQEGRPLRYACNHKVVEVFPGTPAYNMMLENGTAGEQADLRWARVMYEPLYGLPERIEDMSPEHREWCEDLVAGALGADVDEKIKVVGRLVVDGSTGLQSPRGIEPEGH